MRHYESLEEAFGELREPTMAEIEGVVDIAGKHFIITGKTVELNPEDDVRESYKIWIEEKHSDRKQNKFDFMEGDGGHTIYPPDYFHTENF